MHTTREQRQKIQRQRREMQYSKTLSQVDQIIDQSMPHDIVDIDDVCTMLGCSKRTIWRKVSEGLIPQPMGLGKKSCWSFKTILSVRESFSRNKKTVHTQRVRDGHGRFTVKELQNGSQS